MNCIIYRAIYEVNPHFFQLDVSTFRLYDETTTKQEMSEIIRMRGACHTCGFFILSS